MLEKIDLLREGLMHHNIILIPIVVRYLLHNIKYH